MQGLLDGSRIAVFHDDSGALAAPTAASAVAVYVRGEGDWSEGKRHSFSLTQGAGLSELREQMQTLAANLGDCRIVVGAEDHAKATPQASRAAMAPSIWVRRSPTAVKMP